MAGHNICMVATFLHPFNLCLKLLKPFSNGHKLKLVLQQLQTTLLLVLAFKNILKPCSTSSKDCAFYVSSCYPLMFHCVHVNFGKFISTANCSIEFVIGLIYFSHKRVGSTDGKAFNIFMLTNAAF